MLRSFVAAIVLFVALAPNPAAAQQSLPGDACADEGHFIQSTGPEINGAAHFIVCNSGVWQPAISFSSAGNLTELGNQTCNSGEVLKFDGAKWACASDEGDNLGDHTATSDLNLANHNIVGAGSVQVANDGNPCTSAKDGAIRYVTSNDPPWEFCDGGTTTWAPFKQPRCEDDDTGECYLDADRSDDDPDFTAANIADGVNILGVTGTYTGGGCTAPASCTSVGDVCSDGSLFAGFMLYNGSCEPLYVTDNNQSTSSQWKAPPPFAPPFSGNDIPNPVDQYDAVDGQYNRDNRGSGSFPAFELCENNTYHGKSDWYLPARGELNLLWLNRAAISANAAGDFDGLHYWSSTEPIAAAWVQYFYENGFGNHGEQFYDDKDAYYAVRCVRRD